MAQRIDQLAGTVKDHAALFNIVIQDIQKLDKTLTKEIRRLKAPRRRKPRIGFHIGDPTFATMTSQVATESRVPVWMITWPTPKSPDEVLAVWRDDPMETITAAGLR
jgi:hypothetical protein